MCWSPDPKARPAAKTALEIYLPHIIDELAPSIKNTYRSDKSTIFPSISITFLERELINTKKDRRLSLNVDYTLRRKSRMMARASLASYEPTGF